MANFAQSLVGDLERNTVTNPGGVQGVRPPPPTPPHPFPLLNIL